MEADSVRVLLVDDDTHGIAPVAEMLRAEPGPQFLIETSTSLAETERLLRDHRPHIILFNLVARDGGLPGLALLQVFANVPVIVLAPAEHETLALKAVYRHADEYLLTDEVYETLLVRSILHTIERRRVDERRRAAERSLRASERRYRALFEQSRDALYITDRFGAIIEVNAAMVRLVNYGIEELYGKTLATILADPADYDALHRLLREKGGAREVEMRLRHRDGHDVWCLLSAAARVDDDEEARGAGFDVGSVTGGRRPRARRPGGARLRPRRPIEAGRRARRTAPRREGSEPD
jgi:PAS domain S-box-containing protein